MNAPVEVKMLRSIDLALPEIPNLPEPLKVRRAQISDAEKIATLCGHGYIGEIWDKKSTEIELFHDKTIKAVLLVTLKTRLVATASLQLHTDSEKTGQIRWVVTESDMRRQGLAKSLVVRLLDISATEKCKETYLKTTTDATSAIALYLDLGFKPMVCSEKERLVWTDVLKLLGVNPCF